MATRKSKGMKLEHLIGKTVKIQQHYKDIPEGPYRIIGADAPFLFLLIDGHTVACNMHRMDVIAEYPEPTDDEQ